MRTKYNNCGIFQISPYAEIIIERPNELTVFCVKPKGTHTFFFCFFFKILFCILTGVNSCKVQSNDHGCFVIRSSGYVTNSS